MKSDPINMLPLNFSSVCKIRHEAHWSSIHLTLSLTMVWSFTFILSLNYDNGC